MLNNKIPAIDHIFWKVGFNQHLGTDPFDALVVLYSPTFSVQYKNRICDTRN